MIKRAVHFVGFAFTKRALQSLEGLPPKVRKQIAKRAKNLLLEPHPHQQYQSSIK